MLQSIGSQGVRHDLATNNNKQVSDYGAKGSGGSRGPQSQPQGAGRVWGPWGGALGLGTTWAGSAEVLGQAGLRLPNEGCP